jgi:NADP-dependent 3-hydroxy acid dehydrogenase YdfG
MARPLVILVTGATAGIGKAAALHLQKKGHRVIGTGRNEKALAELKTLGIDALALDVTSQKSIDAAKAEVDRLTEGYGVDVLVNNAGYGLAGPVEMLSDADVRAQFDTNVFGLLAVTRAFLPAMRERRSGRVVNVSSVGGRMTFPLGGAYHATKYAVEALSDALRMELRGFGVKVSVIEPGYIKTDFTATTMGYVEKYAKDGSPYAPIMQRVHQAGEGAERFAVGPSSVCRAIESASVSRFPRARYVAPFYNAMGPILMALVPTFVTDWFFGLVTGLSNPPALPAVVSTQKAAPAKAQPAFVASA